MGTRLRLLVTAAMALPGLLGFPGCSSAPQSAPPAETVRESPWPKEKAPPGEVPPHRRPRVAGGVLVYPVQWRNAEELAYRLHEIFYPKYGDDLRIVPDPINNTLLIYLPEK